MLVLVLMLVLMLMLMLMLMLLIHSFTPPMRHVDDFFRWIIPIGWSIALSLATVASHLLEWLSCVIGSIMLGICENTVFLVAVVAFFFDGIDFHLLLTLPRLLMLSMLLYRSRLFLEDFLVVEYLLLILTKLPVLLMLLRLSAETRREGLIKVSDDDPSNISPSFAKSWRHSIWRRWALVVATLFLSMGANASWKLSFTIIVVPADHLSFLVAVVVFIVCLFGK